jgi:hypothetical protein
VSSLSCRKENVSPGFYRLMWIGSMAAKLDNQTVKAFDLIMPEFNGGEMVTAGQKVPSRKLSATMS